jgi:hypothetical protein
MLYLYFSCSIGHKEQQNVRLSEEQPSLSGVADSSKRESVGIVKMDNIDKLESLYYNKVRKYKDSILNSFKLSNIPEVKAKNRKIQNPTARLKRSLKTGDMREFIELMDLEILSHKEINPIPYYLYMAERHHKAAAYGEIFYYLNIVDSLPSYTQYILREDAKRIKFEYMDNNLRNLALWSMLTSYNKGNIKISATLAEYFRNGVYFPRDAITANVLDSLYAIRPSDDITLYK